MRLRKDGKRDRRYLNDRMTAELLAKVPIVEAKIDRIFKERDRKAAISNGSVASHIYQCKNCNRKVRAASPRPGNRHICKVCGEYLEKIED